MLVSQSKGVNTQSVCVAGFGLVADQPGLLPVCQQETAIELSQLQMQSEGVKLDLSPRTCQTKGVACCNSLVLLHLATV